MAALRSSTLCILLLALFFLTSPLAATNKKEIIVKSGQNIQDAINKADRGTRIIVEKGDYTEQLLINKDDITLIGKPGALLIAPTEYKPNECTGLAENVTTLEGLVTQVMTHAGICIIGRNVVLEDFKSEHKKVQSVGEYVRDVSVTGFQVIGFNGLSIVTVGSKNAHIYKNKLVDGGKYGFLTVGSINTIAEQNTITCDPYAPKFIALCMDDKSNVKIKDNNLSWYVIGLCVQTNGAEVKGNHVTNTCYGAIIDPGVKGAKLSYNHIRDTPAYCGLFLPFPATFGIRVYGAQNSLVKHNRIRNITASGAQGKTGIGISVEDNTDFPPPLDANGNVVKENFLRGNDLDIKVASKGTGNVAKKNHCTTSDPVGACAS